MSGWQLSGDAPSLYNRFAIRAMEHWTDDLIRQANCKDGERVLDLACGTGFASSVGNLLSSSRARPRCARSSNKHGAQAWTKSVSIGFSMK
jgi:hypothetical protein